MPKNYEEAAQTVWLLLVVIALLVAPILVAWLVVALRHEGRRDVEAKGASVSARSTFGASQT